MPLIVYTILEWPLVYPFTSLARRWTKACFSDLLAETTVMWCGGSEGKQRQHKPTDWADRFRNQIPIVNGWAELRRNVWPLRLTGLVCVVRGAWESCLTSCPLWAEVHTLATSTLHDPLGLEQPQQPPLTAQSGTYTQFKHTHRCLQCHCRHQLHRHSWDTKQATKTNMHTERHTL